MSQVQNSLIYFKTKTKNNWIQIVFLADGISLPAQMAEAFLLIFVE